jgi:hypothetical protein
MGVFLYYLMPYCLRQGLSLRLELFTWMLGLEPISSAYTASPLLIESSLFPELEPISNSYCCQSQRLPSASLDNTLSIACLLPRKISMMIMK